MPKTSYQQRTLLTHEQETQARLNRRRCARWTEGLFEGEGMVRCHDMLVLEETGPRSVKVRLHCSFHGWVEWKETCAY